MVSSLIFFVLQSHVGTFAMMICLLISGTLCDCLICIYYLLGKNKRKRKEKEDDALVEIFKDLVNGGTPFKVDNGFKLGFLNTVAEKLNAKLPKSNLKAQPHMRSRLRHFKANDWRGKLCPYEEDLCIIFVKDRALGNDAHGPEEMESELNEEEENKDKKDESKCSSTEEPSRVKTSSWKSRNLGTWVRASDNLVISLLEIASILEREIRATIIDFDIELREKHSKLNEELTNLELTTMEQQEKLHLSRRAWMYFSIFLMLKKSECKLFFWRYLGSVRTLNIATFPFYELLL
ncbi:LOW QUALITY PROTEIN: hypothetical protein Cgig2_027443 [Carnegiea gigantea]|uniref:Uncharacterized protein n=1 Tax=Carnegiea gigantea TaxID=171969 RepID=A0A9Q1JK58_9CARY|nr:LOW QUALITY PROTEIN: hypothetical protein Cgig2_027443 [Carnegiea gigantea]